MHLDGEFLADPLCQRTSPNRLARDQLLVDEGQYLGLKLVWPARPSLPSVVGSTEHTWRISNTNTIQRWNGSSWAAAVNGAGVRIDVAGSTPWIVTSAGLARQRNSAGTDWIDRGDLDFVDIGASASGTVWALRGPADGNGNYKVYRFCSGVTWQEVDGKARHIDVGPNNAPWVVTTAGSIFQRSGVTTGNPNGSSWSDYGSGARDVGVAADGSTWITGTGSSGKIYLLNVQPAVAANCSSNPSACNVEAQNRWFATVNGGTANFVTAGVLPWVVGPDNSIWRRNK